MSQMYFKCPVCGNKEKLSQYTKATKRDFLGAICKCKDGSIFQIDAEKNNFLNILDELNIQWGYDEIVWRDWNAGCFSSGKTNRYWNGCTAQVFYKNDFILYDVEYQVYKSKFHFASVDNVSIGRFNTRESAIQACEEDFQRRKASK